MEFKDVPKGHDDRLREELKAIHPELAGVLIVADTWSKTRLFPALTLTELVRTKAEDRAMYVKHYRRLIAALEPGPYLHHVDPEEDGTYRPLNLKEIDLAKDLRARVNNALAKSEGRTGVCLGVEARGVVADEVLSRIAAERFTWHHVRCAVDIRTRHYSEAQRLEVVAFFAERCKAPLWQVLAHDVTAPHLHVARHDRTWRTKYSSP